MLTKKAKITVIKLLKSKFENLPKQYEEQIMKLSCEVVANMMTEIFDLEEIEDIDKYL